ncbi:MAG: nucleoside triphosphate pyrophosphohydrolase [Actinomycetota bacterium]|nr:nucleoside triphosphate pyrophosphohydrolase [Actinomycetota bacterium]
MTGGILIIGLGPAGLDRLSAADVERLTDPASTLIVRTREHPAASDLAEMRSLVSCDDLYEAADDFDGVYDAIVERVVTAARSGPVVFAVPGSAVVGERAATRLVTAATGEEIPCVVVPGESFVDLACVAVGIDPIADGLQILDARALPDPLPLHLPSLITQIDTPLVAGDVALVLGRILPDSFMVTMLDRVGDHDAGIAEMTIADLPRADTGPRSTLFVPAADVGWLGLVATNRILRRECPWDAEQTHHSLVSHLIEETYETVDAISMLTAEAPAGDVDLGDYLLLEEELGDLLLQIVFHAGLAAEAGAFDIDEVAEGIRRKIVGRHPHVFGDVVATEVGEVLANWEELKNAEKGRESLMDDIPAALPGIVRAEKIQRRVASVGFDWVDDEPVFAKVAEELEELGAVRNDRNLSTAELGDLLFAVVNLARHLNIDTEIALSRANDTFAIRFRVVERLAAEAGRRLRDLDLAELDHLWEKAKAELSATDTDSSFTLKPERTDP